MDVKIIYKGIELRVVGEEKNEAGHMIFRKIFYKDNEGNFANILILLPLFVQEGKDEIFRLVREQLKRSNEQRAASK